MDLQIKTLSDPGKLCGFLEKVDRTFPIPLSQKTALATLAAKLCEKGTVFSMAAEEETVGVLGMYANDTEKRRAYISVVAVLPDYQGRGIAKGLLSAALDLARTCGMKEIFLYTHKTNTGAIRLYERAGFKGAFDRERPEDILFTLEL